MKKILIVLAAGVALAFFVPDSAEAGGPRVHVSFGFPGAYYSGGYYCAPTPVYYAPRRYYYRPVRAYYKPKRYYRAKYYRGGYRNYYRGRRYCR